jgi:hypothetical protein
VLVVVLVIEIILEILTEISDIVNQNHIYHPQRECVRAQYVKYGISSM